MQVSNWITARFADGPNFVSDAIDPLAASIQVALETRTSLGPAVEFGACELGEGAGSLIYLRIANADGDFFTHAVTCPRGEERAPAYRIERAFAQKYGEPVGPRARELMTRLAGVTIAQAMLTLTDAFLDESCLAALSQDAELAATTDRTPTREGSKGRRRNGAARTPNHTLPWLIATASVGVAGYLAGQLYPIGLPAVSSGPRLPPGLELPDGENLERANPEQLGPAEMPLSSQIEFERRGHAEELTALRSEVDRLNQQLGAREPADATELPIAEASPSAEAPESSDLSAAEAGAFATVDADLLWVRGGPGIEHARLVRLERNDRVELAGSPEGEWSQIVEPTEGWVATRFLSMPTR